MTKENRTYPQMRLDQDGREYRGFSNINWGRHYNAESQAHHCRAVSANMAKAILKKGIRYQNLQVRTAQGWRWVTEVPEHLGGISAASDIDAMLRLPPSSATSAPTITRDQPRRVTGTPQMHLGSNRD